MNACITARSAWTMCIRSWADHSLSSSRSETVPRSGWRDVLSEVRLGGGGQELEAQQAQGGVLLGQRGRIGVGRDRGSLDVGLVAPKLRLPGHDRPDALGEDRGLGVGGMAEALQRGPLPWRRLALEQLAIQHRQRLPAAGVDAEHVDRLFDEVAHAGDRSTERARYARGSAAVRSPWRRNPVRVLGRGVHPRDARCGAGVDGPRPRPRAHRVRVRPDVAVRSARGDPHLAARPRPTATPRRRGRPVGCRCARDW